MGWRLSEKTCQLPAQLNPQYKMKSTKSIIALVVLSLLTAGFAYASSDKKEAPASKQAGCCVEAAKDGNNCEKCKGSGKIEKKEEAKK